MCNLIDFIKNGNLSDVSLGLSDLDIKAKIGDPLDKINLSVDMILWSFGYGLELYFVRNKLEKISIKYDYISGQFNLPSYFDHINRQCLTNIKSVDELVILLDENAIEWVIYKQFTDEATICIFCNNNSYVFYCLEGHHILSIQCTVPEF